jgi:hypothetical protein
MANPGSDGPPGATPRPWPATILQIRAERAVKRLERWAQLSRERPNLVIRLRQQDDGKRALEAAEAGSPARTYPDADAMFADLLPQDPP